MKKIIFLNLVIFLFHCPLYSQKVLSASQIDVWPTEGKVTVPLTYNRISSFIYVINAKKYLDLFDGKKYTKEQRKSLGIKENDKPDFLQMSVRIDDQDISKDPIMVPLLLANLRDKTNFKQFESFKGPILDNLNIENVNNDVMGSIEVNALISNASAKFWSEVAKIASDFGISAIALTSGNSKGASDLTAKLTNYLTKGINEIGKLSNGGKLEKYSFFVTLIDRSDESTIEEIVTAVRLYQIHWIENDVTSTNYFSDVNLASELSPKQFAEMVSNKDIPVVLVIETRSRSKINVGEPTFTEDYKKLIINEYKEYPLEDQPLLKSYYENYSYAYSAFNYLKNYNLSVSESTTDWNSLLYAIDNTYRFRINTRKEEVKYTSDAYSNYTKRYEAVKERYWIINDQLGEIYKNVQKKNIQLDKANALLEALLKPLKIEEVTNDKLYAEIQKLSYYDTWISSISADASTLKSSESYLKSQELKKNYESSLNYNLTRNLPSNNEQKLELYSNILKNHESCSKCISEATQKIALIKQETLASLTNAYINLKQTQITEFSVCTSNILSSISLMKTKIANSPEAIQKEASANLLEIESNIRRWNDNVTRETPTAKIEEIGIWTVAISDSREKIKKALDFLDKLGILPSELRECQK